MTSDSALERTIDKILGQTESNILSSLNEALIESQQKLENSSKSLEQEYDQIINNGKKEADKIEKQITGSANLEVRNKQLTTVEETIEKVFKKALDEIANTDRNDNYSNLIKSLLDESTKILGTTDIVVFTNNKDKKIVQSLLSQYPGSKLSSETIECLGGVKVKSKDGAMTFDDTIDARIERLKPLIRKNIATQIGVSD